MRKPVSDPLNEIWSLFVECQFGLVLFSFRGKKAIAHFSTCSQTKNPMESSYSGFMFDLNYMPARLNSNALLPPYAFEEMPYCFVYKSGFAFMYRVLLIIVQILLALLMQLVALGIQARYSKIHQCIPKEGHYSKLMGRLWALFCNISIHDVHMSYNFLLCKYIF